MDLKAIICCPHPNTPKQRVICLCVSVGLCVCLWVGYFNFCAKVGLEQTFEFWIISFGRIYQTMNFGTASKLILVANLKNGHILPTGQWYAPSAVIKHAWY